MTSCTVPPPHHASSLEEIVGAETIVKSVETRKKTIKGMVVPFLLMLDTNGPPTSLSEDLRRENSARALQYKQSAHA